MRTAWIGIAWSIAFAGVGLADEIYSRRDTWPESMTATRGLWLQSPPEDRAAALDQLYRKLWEDFPEMDWFLQDQPSAKPGSEDYNVARDLGWYLEPGRDAGAEATMIRRVLAELGSDAAAFETRLRDLLESSTAVEDPSWLELYVEACRTRRARRLDPLFQKAPRWVFTKHYTLGGSHYAYTEGQSDAQAERHFVPGAALCLAEWDGRAVRIDTLLEDPDGVIRDPDVSYDGRRIVFAWKQSDRKDDYHLHELDLESRQVRQITHGLGIADYEPAYLPDGDLLFNSTRCVQIVDCWWTEVSNLYRCDRDGGFLRRLTFDQVHDNFPTVTEDGRILYTRWEYNDRGQVYPQPLLQMNPDGTNQTDFYGGNSWFPTTILHARGIPGSRKVLAIATGHHSRQTGKLIVITPSRGRQENQGVELVAPLRPTPAVRVDAYGQNGELFQYPYPLSETEYVVTYHPMGWRWSEGGYGPRFGVYFMTQDGRRERLAFDPVLPCSQPVPLQPRAVQATRASLVDYGRSDGTCYVQDVYAGPGLAGVPRGTVTTLRVVALEFRAAGIGSNSNGGPGGGALISTPIAIGNGAWDPKIILGDVDVHPDGSALFRLPARTPVYFQLLDGKGRLVQTMRSWVTLQPGENASCVGCHEDKNQAPLAVGRRALALESDPQDPRPFYGPTRGFSFPREVQPILDRHCVKCHDGDDPDLSSLLGEDVKDAHAKRRWSRAYLSLTHSRPDDGSSQSSWRGRPDHPVVNWVSSQSAPPMLPPYSAGSSRSKLVDMLEAGHGDTKLSSEELARIVAWIDLGVPFCGDYTEAHEWTPAEVDLYERFQAKRDALATEESNGLRRWLRQSVPSRLVD